MDPKTCEILEHRMCKELDSIAVKVSGAAEMSVQELEKVDKLFHALKSMATYKAMKEAEEYEEGGMSGRRGRAGNGQYVSRNMSNRQSYDEGYSRGYADAQSGGHMPPYYPRNW